MRHRKSGRKFNRNSSHRKAMFSNMSASLIEHEFIKTTVAKAKELRRTAEPLITLAKEDSVANRRLAFARLRDKQAVKTLFTELGPRYQGRPGGYIRILKCGYRPGDNAPMAYVELVDRPLPDFSEAETLVDAPEAKAAPAAALFTANLDEQPADDLKLISGVGPKLEGLLNGLGIYHFSQIAEFTPEDVEKVDDSLSFHGRIERDGWIEQAKILAAGGETEFSKKSK